MRFYEENRIFRLLAESSGWNDLPGAIEIG